jgi:hypothetical protein
MRRILFGLFFTASVASSGCITADDKRQWQEAVRDLRGDNMRDIAPLSNSIKKPTPPPKASE